MQNTQFSQLEILEWHKSFLVTFFYFLIIVNQIQKFHSFLTHFVEKSDCPNGFLDCKSLSNAFKKVYPLGRVDMFCKYLFKAIQEENGEEKINFFNFMQTLSIFTDNDINKKLKFTFKIFNAHKNTGTIDLETIIKVCESIEKLHGVKKSPTTLKSHAREIFHRFNKKDLNETLNEEEFIGGILRDPSIVILLNITI